MTKSKTPDPVLIAMTTVLGVAAALGGFAALSALSTPSRLRGRVEALEASIERTQGILSRPRDPAHYLSAPLCHARAAEAGNIVRQEISAAAKASGLAAPTVTMSPNVEDLASQTFPVMFTVDVTDRYDLVLGFLGRLAQSEPEVFADSLDLTSKTSAVSLKLTGRVECLTSS